MLTKRNLQIITFILAIVPTITGIIGLMGVNDPIYGEFSGANLNLLDSNLRFFSGVWLGIGLLIFSIIKQIELETKLFRIIWACIFLGGIGRLISIIFYAIPPAPFIGFTALEIIGAPIFIYWQSLISRCHD